MVYILNKNKYEHLQTLEKPEDKKTGEINKVITLSDGNIATAERGAISIWKPKMENSKKFEFFIEIITNYDTCQLLEVNPKIIVCGIYKNDTIKAYKKTNNKYALLGEITNVKSHGNNSNGMARINDNLFCSGGDYGYIYIVIVDPLQIIEKINLSEEIDENKYTRFLHISNDGYIFTCFNKKIIQYKIIFNKYGDYESLEEYHIIDVQEDNEAIVTTNGKIFYKIITNKEYGKSLFSFNEYRQLSDNVKKSLDKFLNY